MNIIGNLANLNPFARAWAIGDFISKLVNIVLTMDTNHDGTLSNDEKLAGATKAAQALVQTFPGIPGDRATLQEAIGHIVALIRLFVPKKK